MSFFVFLHSNWTEVYKFLNFTAFGKKKEEKEMALMSQTEAESAHVPLIREGRIGWG